MNDDRRRLLGVLGGAVAGGAGIASLSPSASATASAEFTAEDVSVATADGNVEAITVAPAGTVSWSGLEEPADRVRLALYAKRLSDLEYHDLASRRLDAAGLHGEREYGFDALDLFESAGFSPADFEAAEGETVVTSVRLRLEIGVDANDDETLTTGYADAAFDVRVENAAEAVGGSAVGNTDAETAAETTETETTATETKTDATVTETETATETTATSSDDGA